MNKEDLKLVDSVLKAFKQKNKGKAQEIVRIGPIGRTSSSSNGRCSAERGGEEHDWTYEIGASPAETPSTHEQHLRAYAEMRNDSRVRYEDELRNMATDNSILTANNPGRINYVSEIAEQVVSLTNAGIMTPTQALNILNESEDE